MDAKSKSPRSAASIGRTDSRHCRGTDPSALQRMTASALTLSINASYQLLIVPPPFVDPEEGRRHHHGGTRLVLARTGSRSPPMMRCEPAGATYILAFFIASPLFARCHSAGRGY